MCAAAVLETTSLSRLLGDVGGGHEGRRSRTREKIASGIGRIPDADMSVAVEHSFIRQNVIGHDELVNQSLASGSGSGRGLRQERYGDRQERENPAGGEPPGGTCSG
jgi:hypothetical protein